MYALVCTTLLLGAAEKAAGDEAAAPKVDGKWLVVYAERDGKPINAWEQQQVTLAKGVLTYEEDGKPRSIRLKFGPKSSVTATRVEEASGGGEEQADAKAGSGKGSHSGVYIAGRDYFCVSLGGGGKGDKEGEGKFILILRRQAARGGAK